LAQLGADDHLAWICLTALFIQWLMQGVLRRSLHPHYYHGTWICYAYFLWSALSTSLGRLWTRRARALSAVAIAASLALFTTQMVWGLHQNGGTRGIHFGATLSNQLAVAKTLSHYAPDAPLCIEVENLLMFPHALPILRALTHNTGTPDGPQTPLRIRYRDAGSESGWLAVTPDPGPASCTPAP
jgi:hypothetical protein